MFIFSGQERKERWKKRKGNKQAVHIHVNVCSLVDIKMSSQLHMLVVWVYSYLMYSTCTCILCVLLAFCQNPP